MNASARRVLRFLRYLLPYKGLFCLAIATGFLAAAANGVGVPFMVKVVFPIVFEPGHHVPAVLQPWMEGLSRNAVLLLACAFMPAVFVVRGAAMWGNAVVTGYLGLRILENIRTDVFRRLQHLPLSFHDRCRKGDLISRVLADTQSVQTMISQVSNDIVKQPFTALCALAVFIALLVRTGEPSLFAVNLVFVALAVFPVLTIGRRVTGKARRTREGLAEMNSIVQQNLASQREVRSYAMEAAQVAALFDASRRYCVQMLKMVKYQKALVPLVETVTALALSFLLVRGRQMGMAMEDFMALAASLYFCFDSMRRAGTAFNRFSEGRASLERLEAILDAPDDAPDPASPAEPASVRGRITFRHVSFDYGSGSPVLKDIDLEIPPGQIVGLVGPSGAGKTTFASLIPRFYEVTEGEILLDGLPIRRMRKSFLRGRIALVSQNALLFRDTIQENIRFGRPGASDEDVAEAARQASVTSFLPALPQGMRTRVNQGGEGLSGGQRQRVALARAFLRDAPILILDEATASLDSENEQAVQRELELLARGRTTLIVAHRFSAIRMAQRILVFEHGRIVGDGSHGELYAACPLYRELCEKQTLRSGEEPPAG
ncbi:MAG: ABC transporter ATP-binding protein/permease [Akkermansiaceae bacterium]|nr:ABC transporter ATP-binding protein/permease [Akkermansiaceae bacterium]